MSILSGALSGGLTGGLIGVVVALVSAPIFMKLGKENQSKGKYSRLTAESSLIFNGTYEDAHTKLVNALVRSGANCWSADPSQYMVFAGTPYSYL